MRRKAKAAREADRGWPADAAARVETFKRGEFTLLDRPCRWASSSRLQIRPQPTVGGVSGVSRRDRLSWDFPSKCCNLVGAANDVRPDREFLAPPTFLSGIGLALSTTGTRRCRSLILLLGGQSRPQSRAMGLRFCRSS